MEEFAIYYSHEGTKAHSPVNGIRLSFKADTPLIVKELNAQVFASTHKATVTFSHDGKKYKVKPCGGTIVRKKKKRKPETKDKLYYRICGLTKKLKDMK